MGGSKAGSTAQAAAASGFRHEFYTQGIFFFPRESWFFFFQETPSSFIHFYDCRQNTGSKRAAPPGQATPSQPHRDPPGIGKRG